MDTIFLSPTLRDGLSFYETWSPGMQLLNTVLQAAGEFFGQFADRVAVVASVSFRVAKDADVSPTTGAVQLQFPLMVVASLHQFCKAVPSASVLGAAEIAQRLLTVVASGRRPLELSVLAANLAQPLARLEHISDHALQGNVDRQLFDATSDPMSADRTTLLVSFRGTTPTSDAGSRRCGRTAATSACQKCRNRCRRPSSRPGG